MILKFPLYSSVVSRCLFSFPFQADGMAKELSTTEKKIKVMIVRDYGLIEHGIFGEGPQI